MKKCLLFLLFIATTGLLSAQTLYTNTIETGSRYNPGLGLLGTPKVVFDEVLIPATAVAGSDSVRITKLKVGIRRLASAPATNVNVYYSVVEDTATTFDNVLKVPPVLLGTISLPANGATAVTTIVSVGDSISTLFRIKTDTGSLYTGFQTLFVGVSLSSPNDNNGFRLTSGPGINDDVFWLYNADSTVKRFATTFTAAVATFYIQAFGYPVGGSLPVTISDLKGERRGNINSLSWTTATETNNAGFELQRSADGANFSKLAFVASKAAGGNSTGVLNYSIDDAKPLPGGSYYRLQQTDKDGKTIFSKVVFIKGTSPVTLQLSSIYPNPAASVLNLVVTAPASDKINLIVMDLAGKIVLQQPAQVTIGNNNLSLHVARLTAGKYMIKAVCANGCETAVSNFIKE